MEEYKEVVWVFKELGLEIGSFYEYCKEICVCEVVVEWVEEFCKEYEVVVFLLNFVVLEYGFVLYGEEELIISFDWFVFIGDDIYNWIGEVFSDFFVFNFISSIVVLLVIGFNMEDNEGIFSFMFD